MPAVEPISRLLGIPHTALTNEEHLIFELELLIHIYDHLKAHYISLHKDYLRLLKTTTEMENTMSDEQLIYFIIKDILTSEEYSLSGLALYTQIPEEFLFEIMLGKFNFVSIPYSRKILELHRSIRPELYKNIFNKVMHLFFNKNNEINNATTMNC